MSDNAIKRGRPLQAGGFAEMDLSPVPNRHERKPIGTFESLNPQTLHAARCECAVINSMHADGSTSSEIQAATKLARSVIDKVLSQFNTDGMIYRAGFRLHGKRMHTVYKLALVK